MRVLARNALAALVTWFGVGAVAADKGAELPRDPFAAPGAQVEAGEAGPPLRRHRLEDLRLVATAHGGGQPRALIEDPTGLGFVVRAGQTLGVEAATVTRIGRGRLSLDIGDEASAVVGQPLSTAVHDAHRRRGTTAE